MLINLIPVNSIWRALQIAWCLNFGPSVWKGILVPLYLMLDAEVQFITCQPVFTPMYSTMYDSNLAYILTVLLITNDTIENGPRLGWFQVTLWLFFDGKRCCRWPMPFKFCHPYWGESCLLLEKSISNLPSFTQNLIQGTLLEFVIYCKNHNCSNTTLQNFA